jgi:hypothetical protein
MYQYAWEGGEPALWDTSKQMRVIMNDSKDWNKVVEWSWENFARGSMENTHDVLMTAMRNKACHQIKFEDFTTNYEEAFIKWMRIWGMSEKVIPTLLQDLARHDLSRLTPEQKAKHHHISGKSLSKTDAIDLDKAMHSNKALMNLVYQQRTELNYS